MQRSSTGGQHHVQAMTFTQKTGLLHRVTASQRGKEPPVMGLHLLQVVGQDHPCLEQQYEVERHRESGGGATKGHN